MIRGKPPARRRDPHPVAVYLASLQASSQRVQASALSVAARIISSGTCDVQSFRWERIRHSDVVALRACLVSKYRPSTANRILAAVRKTLHTALGLGLLDRETYWRTVDVDWVPNHRKFPLGRVVSPDELQKIFLSCWRDRRYDGRRIRGAQDAAAVALLYGCRLRETQLCALSLDDYRVSEGRYGSVIVVDREGRKRAVPLPGKTDDSLYAWLVIRGLRAGPLFPALTATRDLSDRRLSVPALRQRLRRRAQAAGIAAFRPRDLRDSRTCHVAESAIQVPFWD